MFGSSIRLLLLASSLLLAGCGSSSDNGTADAPPDSPTRPSYPEYTGPTFEFAVETEESATQFRWSVTVPTGGWTLEFMGSKSNPSEGESSIRAVLTRPAPGELVTQALETLTGEYRHGKQAFSTADLLVRLVTKGEDPETVEYALAATWSD